MTKSAYFRGPIREDGPDIEVTNKDFKGKEVMGVPPMGTIGIGWPKIVISLNTPISPKDETGGNGD